MKTEEMKLSPAIKDGLEDVNITELTELQKDVLPTVIEGQDALINAKPGDNKIGSFVIPALELIANKETVEGISTLILTPNPEESQEIDELVWGMGYHAEIECASVDMDSDADEQEEAFGSGVPVIVGNPGPLADVTEKLRYVFRHVDLVVIDAAGEMLSIDLESKITPILRRVLSDHQTLIYTEESNQEVQNLSKNYLEEPAILGFEENSSPLFMEPPKVENSLSHGYIYVPNRMKITTLLAHTEKTPTDKCVIFTASKRGTDRLYRTLRKRDLKATSLHGKLSDEKRNQRFENFKSGNIQYLLVADIPAVKLDLEEVTQVINYDVPNDPDEYRYRTYLVGQDNDDRLVSLVSKQDRSDINNLEQSLSHAPKELPLPDKVKQKVEERKKQKKSKQSKRSNGHEKSKKKKENGMELPQPNFDKLSGGRKNDKAKKDEKSSVIGLIKKLFS